VIIAAGRLAAAVWMLLAIPVLAAGLARSRRRESHDGIRRYAWIGIWIAGVALMVLALVAASGSQLVVQHAVVSAAGLRPALPLDLCYSVVWCISTRTPPATTRLD
jgi:hypothetical protein